MKGWLIRAQQPQSKRISCKGQDGDRVRIRGKLVVGAGLGRYICGSRALKTRCVVEDGDSIRMTFSSDPGLKVRHLSKPGQN